MYSCISSHVAATVLTGCAPSLCSDSVDCLHTSSLVFSVGLKINLLLPMWTNEDDVRAG